MTASDVISTMGVLLFIISIIWGISWMALRFQLVPGQKSKKNKNANSELLIVETLILDTKRRLIKVEDDGFEHLLLLGPTTETHIHSKKVSQNSNNKNTDDKPSENNETLLSQEQTDDKALH